MKKTIRWGVQLPVVSGCLYLLYDNQTRDQQFHAKLTKVFPNISKHNKQVNIVSKTQLEWTLLLCNQYGKTITPREQTSYMTTEHNENSHLFMDYTQFNKVIDIDSQTKQCLVEPGITIRDLNEQLKTQGLQVPVTCDINCSLDQVIQHNEICLESLKYGPLFSDVALERLGIITGSGNPIQTGGYNCSDQFSQALCINKLIPGSQSSLALLFEVLINCQKLDDEQSNMRKLFVDDGLQTSNLAQLVSQMNQYLLKNASNNQLVHGLIIDSKYNNQNCSLTCVANNQEQLDNVILALNRSEAAAQDISLDKLSIDLSSKMSQKDNSMTLEVVLPMTSEGSQVFQEYFDSVFTKAQFQMHLLPNHSLYIKLSVVDSQDDSAGISLETLDAFTSSVITSGGTLKSYDQAHLNKISKYLSSRICGLSNMDLQQSLKSQVFDPNDVLNRGSVFSIQEQNNQTMLQKAMKHNKQINYIFSK